MLLLANIRNNMERGCTQNAVFDKTHLGSDETRLSQDETKKPPPMEWSPSRETIRPIDSQKRRVTKVFGFLILLID